MIYRKLAKWQPVCLWLNRCFNLARSQHNHSLTWHAGPEYWLVMIILTRAIPWLDKPQAPDSLAIQKIHGSTEDLQYISLTMPGHPTPQMSRNVQCFPPFFLPSNLYSCEGPPLRIVDCGLRVEAMNNFIFLSYFFELICL